MIKHVLAITISAALMTAVPLASATAQTPAKTDAKAAKPDAKAKPAEAKPAEAKPEKKLTAQQQKMKDCGAKWQDKKKAENVSGKAAYQKFLSTCLKG